MALMGEGEPWKKRWYQFNDGHSPTFGYGTWEQAQRHLAALNARRATNHYAMTELNDGEEPVAEGSVVDIDSGMTLPTRYKRRARVVAVARHGGAG